MTGVRALIALFIATAFAQDKPAFEVASIRPSKLTIVGGRVRRDPSQLSIVNLTLKEMIIYAWDVQPFQVLGEPPWADSDRFDVSAKPERAVQYHDVMLMMQSLLADRFQLTMHRETRGLPIYALVRARKDGKLGLGIVEAKEGSCVVAGPNSAIARPESGKPSLRHVSDESEVPAHIWIFTRCTRKESL